MSLIDVTYSRKSYGTSSSGALPTNYEMSLEDQRYEDSYISSERPKPSSDNLTAGLDDSYGLSNDIKNPSDVDLWLSVYLNYQGSSNLPNIPKLSNLDNTTRNFNIRLSRAIRSFHADMPTQSRVWLNTSPILLHEDSEWLYIVKTDPQKMMTLFPTSTLIMKLLKILLQT